MSNHVAFCALVALAVLAFWTSDVRAHGTVHDPVARQTRWRYDRSAPVNYDDNQVFCGGFWNQFGIHQGRCGVCGDDWALSAPRPHELGGKYGQGVIVKTYAAGLPITASVRITANHRGHFEFRLCNLDENAGRETAQCFDQHPLQLVNGSDVYELPSDATGTYEVDLQLPAELRCAHCVLQWTYVAGNNWGLCTNGVGRLGCGPQEHFIACSDIRIV